MEIIYAQKPLHPISSFHNFIAYYCRIPLFIVSSHSEPITERAMEGVQNQRLQNYFNSTVLNLIFMWIVALLLPTAAGNLIATIAISLLALAAIVYSIWYWVTKPEHIHVCKGLSNISAWLYVAYFVACWFIADNPDRLHRWAWCALASAAIVTIIFLIKCRK